MKWAGICGSEWLLKANELEAEIPKAASTDDKSALYDQVPWAYISLGP